MEALDLDIGIIQAKAMLMNDLGINIDTINLVNDDDHVHIHIHIHLDESVARILR